MKQLIAYFSRADENYFGGQMKYVEVGEYGNCGAEASEADRSGPVPDRDEASPILRNIRSVLPKR